MMVRKRKRKQINPAFGARVQKLREEAGLSQTELARESGLPIGSLREIEQGRREPLFSAMLKIAKVLGVTLNDLPSPVDE